MTDIKSVIDGDTFKTGDDTLRVGYINTPESVHPNDEMNTPKGEEASDFAKDIMPKGSEVTVHDYGNDHFGRDVAGVVRNINGVDVDYGLVALDQQMSTYFTKYGEHPDPLKHEQYKEYYSRLVPYQLGSSEEYLNQTEIEQMTTLHQKFNKTYSDFKEGDATQEQLDAVTAELYGNPEMVMKYRRTLVQSNYQMNKGNSNTLAGAMQLALDANPTLRDTYNRAVRNGHLQFHPSPEDEPTFWDKAGASFSMLGSISNLTDFENLWDARRLGSDTEIPDTELVKGLPDQYHSMILQESSKYNDHATLVLRDQLLEDIANNKIFDNMEWYAQLGYGAMAVVADPLTLIPAAPLTKGGQALMATNKAWQMTRVIGGKSVIPGSATATKLTAWTGAGAVEGAIFNAPRLGGDHTYTARDYQLDILMDSAFGLGIGTIVDVAVPYSLDYAKSLRASRTQEQSMLLNQVEQEWQVPMKPEETPAATPELQEVKDEVMKTKAPYKAQKSVATQAGMKFPEWSAVSEVTTGGYQQAVTTLRQVFPKDLAMMKLLNVGTRLNKSATPETLGVIQQLNSDILHIASAFPDGKVPKSVAKAIEGVAFKQKTYKRNNALQDVLQGNKANSTQVLEGYVNMLRNHKELWEGYDPVPMGSGEFYKHQADILSVQHIQSADDIFQLSQGLPKELSYIKDVVELNQMALKMNDSKFTELVEEINGMVAVRMEQREFGDTRRYTDSNQSFGKSVPMTPPEIAAQLKKEGLQPRTAEYSKRMKELSTYGRVAVQDEVNALGKLDEFTVDKKAGKQEKLNPETVEAFSKELDELELKLSKSRSGEAEPPTPKEISRAKWLQEALESGVYYKEGTELVGDNLDQDLLPRSYTQTETTQAFKDPTKVNLETMRSKVRGVGNKLGVFEIKGKAELAHNKMRLEKVAKTLKKDRAKVLDRMVKAGQWQPIEDVIRASHAVANQQKVTKPDITPDKPDVSKGKDGTPEQPTTTKQLNEEDLDVLDDSVPKEVHGKTDEEVEQIKESASTAYDKLVEESSKKIMDGVAHFVRTGEKKAFEEARKPRGILDRVGRMAAKITEDIGTKMQNSKLTTLEYFGSRVTEIGKGYGGAIRRRATGGLIRDAIYKESVMQMIPHYVRAMDNYAVAQGKGAVGRMMAQQKAGADSAIVKQFNRDVFTVQELRRQGRANEINVHKSVTEFVEKWDKYMDYNHNKLVENNIGGFKKQRKIKHYIPHIWSNGRLQAAINKHGEDKVTELLRRAYVSAINNGTNPANINEALDLAKRQVEWIKQQDANSMIDQFLPVADSRAKQRLDLDTLTQHEGLSILDLLDDEVVGLGIKYSNRMSGWVGLSKSTDGMITSQMDIDMFKQNMLQEVKDKGVDSGKYEQYYDDVIDLMFGRPTRGGLNQEMRQLKDLTALTRMGGLGTAQLIETGQVITRSVLNKSGRAAKKVIAENATLGKNEDHLIREIQSISNITDDIEWLDRQSVHLDQAELAQVNKVRQMSLWLADKATFGSLKAPASRLLGKTTGFNAIRRAQSRITQASFTVDVARHFRDGKGVMGNARMADLGLTDVNGKDIDLQEAFSKHVEYDEFGLPKKLNVERWSQAAREKFQFAMIRDEAQQVQRTHVGELPPWMNKPMMALIFQFRQMPIVATNKQLGRSLAFADKEAVTAVMLNAMMAGMVRYSKFAVLGLGYAALTDNDQQEPDYKQMQTDKYIAQFGIFPDAKDLVMGAYQAGTSDKPMSVLKDEMLGQVPVLGLMDDYRQVATGDKREQVEAAQGLVPLGNTAYGDMIHTWIQETFGE